MSFYKKNINVENYFIRREFIVFQTDKASFINLPNHNRHIGFWLSNKFIYFIEKHSDQVAIGLIYDNSYPIIKYDENLKRRVWKYLTGTELINLYNQYKQNYFTQMKKALDNRGKLTNYKSVKEANHDKNIFGWFQIDCIVGKEHQSACLVLTEELTKFTICKKLKEQNAKEIVNTLKEIFCKLYYEV